jgi:NADP-dependent 3-hydroxy acid dehydrogenase YdfG
MMATLSSSVTMGADVSHEMSGLTVLLAGAGGGAGAAVARRLADLGASLELCDREHDLVAPLAERMTAHGADVGAATVDLLDAADVQAWVSDVRSRRRSVDGLVHLVGGWLGGDPLASADPTEWAQLEGPLIRSVQNTSRATHDDLLASPRGRFVLVSSREATRPSHTNAAYAAAKAAAETWTLALADAFRDSSAAASILVVKALLTEAMQRSVDDPAKEFPGYTPVAELAKQVAALWESAAGEVNGRRIWLTDKTS